MKALIDVLSIGSGVETVSTAISNSFDSVTLHVPQPFSFIALTSARQDVERPPV